MKMTGDVIKLKNYLIPWISTFLIWFFCWDGDSL